MDSFKFETISKLVNLFLLTDVLRLNLSMELTV
jgi:hypothetical protein